MALQRILETCEPRSDVLQGGLTDAHFAAQLDQVVRDPDKYAVYGDPTEFFAVTYPTDGLKRLLTSTFGRLSGKAGDVEGAEHGVVRFQTSFGGGKTHGLIAAYHLAKGDRAFSIGEFVDPDLLPDSCHVAAVVGDSLEALTGTTIAGKKVQTMWGAIAAQLGDEAWSKVEKHDAGRSAPSSEIWAEILKQAPTLVIIDEVAAHLRTLGSSGDPELRRQAEAMPAFLFNLFTAAAQVDTARVVITLATESDAFGKETTQVEKVLDETTDAGKEAKSVLGRFREVLIPAEDEEISEILRRRLFATIDENAAKQAASEFASTYAELETRETGIGLDAGFAEQLERSYPFHPELIKVLDNRVGTIPEFQRTRGALRLLAESVASLWEVNSDAVIINAADLPLAASSVGNALTRDIGREAFAQVLEADVAGKGSHAAEIDKTRFQAGKPYATRTASTVFLHSLEMTASRGATQVDVLRGTVEPGDDPDLVEEALRLLDGSAWHLDYDGARWRFDTEPNPRKIIEDEKNAVLNSVVREELDRRLGQMFAPHGAMKTKVFATDPSSLDDRPELQLGLIHYETESVTGKSASPPPSTLVSILETHGVAGSNRTYRNGVVFLVADTDHIESMRNAVKWDLAAARIRNDTERMQSYAEAVQKKLKDIADKAGLDARVAITNCYRHLYYPKADRANKNLRHHELPATARGDQEKNQTQAIQQALEGIGKIRNNPVSTDFFSKVAGFPGSDPITTKAAVDGFWKDHDSDIILDPNLLTDVIASGVKNGSWVYYDADTERAYTEDNPPPAAKISTTCWLYSREKAESDGLLTREPTWADVERELTKVKGELNGTELRSRLETALKSEPSKTSVVEILARVIRQDPAPIVVVDGEPNSDSKPLPPSSVTKISLDRLHILTRERAEKIGIEVGDGPRGFRMNQTGPAGPVFGALGDKLSELGEGKKLTSVEITKVASAASTTETRTLLSAVTMLPKLGFTVTLNGSGTFDALSGEVTISYLSGAAADFRKVERDVLDLLDKANDFMLTLTLVYRPDEPVATDGDEWKSLADTLSDLKPGEITVTVAGT